MSRRTDLGDLDAFLAVARAGGFRKAGIARGVSGSALSHAMRGLEDRLGVRLFHRNNRSVALTAAGEALLADLEPRFRGIDEAVERLERFRARPAGRVRVTALRDAARLLITPKLPAFIARFPDIDVEITVDDRFVDMVGEGYDAGIRYGGTVPEDMIASRLTPDLDWVIVGSPDYLKTNGRPERPADLMAHRCIRIRAGQDRIYRWELGEGIDEVALDVPGHLTLDDSELSIRMAEAGVGLFYCLKDRVKGEIEAGTLEVVLAKWVLPSPGFHAYYASHRQVPSALRAFLDHLRGDPA
ncbi:LysR family transcriptional regulator [Sphingomonas sp. CCH5-D11]|uniref:LysR family transcriptional regulator n=1 Tax=Sphingomonas sp. CCH5-D11 TaxID=1768786 RepID=UPI00082A4252|nr:LysR family transcriptional regulator [Sphingomonas sp. CCH5-D11]